LPQSLRVQGTAIQHSSRRRIAIVLGEYIELFLSPLVVTRKAEQLEQEGAALDVGWVFPQTVAQRLDCLIQSAGLVQLSRVHETPG
jgi:hypothetical protein